MNRKTKIAATFALAVGTAGAGFYGVRGKADPAAESALAGIAVSALVLLRGRGKESEARRAEILRLKSAAETDARNIGILRERNTVALEVYKSHKTIIERQRREIGDLTAAFETLQEQFEAAIEAPDDIPSLPIFGGKRGGPGNN